METNFPVKTIRFKRRTFYLVLVDELEDLPPFVKTSLFYKLKDALEDERVIMIDSQNRDEFFFLPLPSEALFRKKYRVDLDKFFDRFDPKSYSFRNAKTVELNEAVPHI